MKSKGRKNLRPFSRCLLPLFLAFCFLSAPSAYPLSIEKERAAGEKFLQNIRKHFEIVKDPYIQDFINQLGRYLSSSLQTKPFPFHFYVINAPALNAFAGPGGHIFIFSGLINILEVDELAAVICHEIGHVSARHISQRIEKNKMLGIATMASVLAAVLIGGKAGGAIITGSVAAGMQAQLHYSREDERQADQLAFKYMDASGFSPSAIIRVLKKLQKERWVGGEEIPPYLLTHPGASERIARIESMLAGYSKGSVKPEAAEFKARYPIFKTVLTGTCLDPGEAERRFQDQLEQDPDAGPAHLGLGIALMRKSEYERAAKHLELARKAMPRSVTVLRFLGESYQFQGRDEKAVRVLEEALRLERGNRSVLYILAGSYLNLEKYPRAIRIYEKLKNLKPVMEGVYYQLGVAYGRQKELGRAHYNFGLHFARMKDMEKARFHFEKALAFARNDRTMEERIKKAMRKLRASPGGSRPD
ncbi:MAG: M48 family metalloprotease [Deltaproteobacteria bacterium]|nr:M48 family metalloprotease [Deltaproteobacteria bacterium]